MSQILGINISHDCSFAYFKDGVLQEFYEEARFNKEKHFCPTVGLHVGIKYEYEYEALKKFKDIEFDIVCFSSYGRDELLSEHIIIKHLLSQIKHKNHAMYFDALQHHIHHAVAGYYFSNFKEALVLVRDGGGSRYNWTEVNSSEYFKYHINTTAAYRENESIYYIDEKNIKEYYKTYVAVYGNLLKQEMFENYKCPEDAFRKHHANKNIDVRITDKLRSGALYLHYCKEAGFDFHCEGQLMGIAAYKNKKTDLSKKVLEIANKAQEETLEEGIELVERAMKYNDCKNIILSGGYHLNCANNFKLVKHFPKLNFFVDPIPYDAGCAVGVVKYYENYYRQKNSS